MTPLHTPPHLWAPYPDETAPRSLPIRGVVDAETRRFIRGNAWACQRSRIKSGTVKPDDLAFELGAFR
jgi:hypothetical protein